MEKDYCNFKPKNAETTPQNGPIWCAHRISLRQRKCHSRCTIQGSTPETRVPRLQHLSKQHTKNPSSQDHTNHTSKSREATRNMRGQIKGPSTKTTGRCSAWRMAKDNQRLSPQYTVILVLQRWDHMWRRYFVQKSQIDYAPVWASLEPPRFCTGDTMQSIRWTSGLERQSI